MRGLASLVSKKQLLFGPGEHCFHKSSAYLHYSIPADRMALQDWPLHKCDQTQQDTPGLHLELKAEEQKIRLATLRVSSETHTKLSLIPEETTSALGS